MTENIRGFKSTHATTLVVGAKIRRLVANEVDEASQLVHKFWSLNSEFEPTIELRDAALAEIRKNVQRGLGNEEEFLLVAELDGRLVGLIRAEVRPAAFYEPRRIGNIVEFYVVPKYRRQGVGKALLDAALDQLKAKGIELVTAEFPTQNIVAVGFYEQNAFRPFVTVYARKLA